MNVKPPIPSTHYNQEARGVYGEFGSGAGSRAFYVQSAMSPVELENVSLVSDIPGSEKWPVRALFQRDIDTERVLNGLVPYLRDATQVRFFNPITLTLLPMDDTGHGVLKEIPDIARTEGFHQGQECVFLERSDFYRIRWIKGAPEYATIAWNTKRCRLVAIDGQHRLFGLKHIWSGPVGRPPDDDFQAWRIPVVIVSFRTEDEGGRSPGILDTIRRMFVSINTNAQRVNAARRVLLSDDSINSLCTQELVDVAHSNDRRPRDERDERKIPLLFFDWRGEERDEKRIKSPAALHDIVEVRDWFETYILGEDLDSEQKKAMEVLPTSPLHEAFAMERLTHQQTELVRAWARKDLLPALTHLLSEFRPYAQYIRALRGLENQPLDPKRSELAGHALDEIRFGTSRAHSSLHTDVRQEVARLIAGVDRAKERHLDKILRDDIGFRGIVWAFGALRDRFFGPPNWREYSVQFTDALNRVHRDGWLGLDAGVRHRDLLLHVVEDPAGTIVNYRPTQAKGALGCHVALLVAAYGVPWPKEWKFARSQFLEEKLDVWRSTVERGYRKQFRVVLKEKYPEGGKPLTDAVRRKAGPAARARAERMRKALDTVVNTRRQAG